MTYSWHFHNRIKVIPLSTYEFQMRALSELIPAYQLEVRSGGGDQSWYSAHLTQRPCYRKPFLPLGIKPLVSNSDHPASISLHMHYLFLHKPGQVSVKRHCNKYIYYPNKTYLFIPDLYCWAYLISPVNSVVNYDLFVLVLYPGQTVRYALPDLDKIPPLQLVDLLRVLLYILSYKSPGFITISDCNKMSAS